MITIYQVIQHKKWKRKITYRQTQEATVAARRFYNGIQPK
jgi:hypothetical protein